MVRKLFVGAVAAAFLATGCATAGTAVVSDGTAAGRSDLSAAGANASAVNDGTSTSTSDDAAGRYERAHAISVSDSQDPIPIIPAPLGQPTGTGDGAGNPMPGGNPVASQHR